MRYFRFLFALLVVSVLPLLGCGSGEATSVDPSELESYVEENAAQLAAEEAAEEAEEAAEDAEDDD